MHRPSLITTLFLCLLLLPSIGLSQKKKSKPKAPAIQAPIPNVLECATATTREEPIGQLDLARIVTHFDATPNGDHWVAVDKFGQMQGIVIDGNRFSREFNEIPVNTAQLSPNGSYTVWMGLTRGVTMRGFDSTVTTIFRGFDSVGQFVSDYNTLSFSRSGAHWAAILPYANEMQSADRNIVLVDGKVVGKNESRPRQFVFGEDESEWGFRTTVGDQELLTTSDGNKLTIRRVAIPANPYALVKDSAVWHYSPNGIGRSGTLEAYDFDFGTTPVAKVYRTSYDVAALDTARVYLTYGSYRSGLYKWIANVLVDSTGKHFGFLASAPGSYESKANNGLVIIDGKVVGGPYPELARLYMSPSGKHYAYTGNTNDPELYVDAKPITKARTLNVVWSPDEKEYAYVAAGSNQKLFVVAGGKRSAEYERIGRVGWAKNGKSVEFIALRNGKLLRVRQQI
jgi:hypothetical protein